MNLAPGELLVGRAWRWSEEQIRIDIEIDRRVKMADGEQDPPATISVFAVRHQGTDVEATLDRLKTTILKNRNAKWLAVLTESELTDAGYKLELSEPPPDHYDLILGREATAEAIVDLADLFNETRERVRLS